MTLESKAQWRLWDDQVLEKELQVLDHALHSAYAVDLTLSIGPSLSLEFKGFSSGKIQSQKEFLGLIQWTPHDPAGEYEIKARESLVRKAANLLNPQTLDALFSEKFPDFKSDEDGYLTLSLVDLFAHFKMYSQSSTDKIRLQNEKEYEQVKKNAVAQFGYSETDTLIENEGFSIQFTFVDNGWSALIRMKPEAVQLRRKEYLQDIQAQADEFVKNKVANLITDAVESGEFGEGDAYPADFMGAVIRSIQAGELGTELRKRQDEEQGSQYF